MPVAARVDITKPSLLLFDPDDEIAVFPACLLRGLTERFYRPDETTSKLEGMMTQQYYDFQSALTLLMTEQQVDLEWVEENCWGMGGEEIVKSEELNGRLKMLLLTLQSEIMGIPFIQIVSADRRNGDWKKWSEFTAMMTVWRQRVENVQPRGFAIEETIEILQEFGEGEDELMQQFTKMVSPCGGADA